VRHNSLHIIKDFVFVFLSATLIVLSFPDFSFGWLAWFGLVPLLWVLSTRGPGSGFLLAHACGMLVIIGGFFWILEIDRYTWLHHVFLVAYLGLYVGLFGLAFSLICQRWGLIPAFAAAPFIWVALEYLRSNLAFLALPWLLLSHSQYEYVPIIQVAAVTGAYGISFLIVLVNAALAMVVLNVGRRLRGAVSSASELPSSSAILGMIFFTATFATSVLLYGEAKLSTAIEGPEFTVAVVQANIAQERKWDRQHAEDIMTNFTDLSRRALVDQPDLIVWPETATPGSISRNRRVNARVHNLARELEVSLLLGSSQQRKFGSVAEARLDYRNSAFLIPPARGAVKHQRYDKIRLLPFGEYLPLKQIIPWDAIDIPDVGGYTAGSEFTVFEMSDARFAVTICWENIFPDLVRQFVRNGAQFIINITNEAWFGKTAAPYQFLSMSVLRAVENGVFVIRCANTGISGFIDPKGRVYARVANKQGVDIFISGVLTGSVILQKSKTLYTRFGDWFVWFSIAAAIISIGTAFVVRRKVE
jgi:apolipoprotein N-acyltransferase